jgi:hypothetical protein
MNNAVELFTAVPKLHNCAQAVAEGCGNKELAELMKTCGGGKAPEGRCGALHAALSMTPESCHAALTAEFVAAAHAPDCASIKAQTPPTPCAECVRIAAELVEKYR